jgi:uncharacterized protein YbaR (Trm112 family)
VTDDTLISPDLLAIMQCPICTGELAEQEDPPALVCQKCGRVYPVTDGIPNMIVDDG